MGRSPPRSKPFMKISFRTIEHELMHVAHAICCMTLFFILQGCHSEQEQIVLVKEGLSKATIVVACGASEETRFAAEELRNYLEKISGAKLRIVDDSLEYNGCAIRIGPSQRVISMGVKTRNLEKEGFQIKTLKDNLILLGQDETGTLFAVYTFLEKYLGVRWLWPGELGEVVPQMKDVVVGPIDESEQPDFRWRDRGPGGALWAAAVGPTEMHARARLLGITEAHQFQVKLWEKRLKWGGMRIYGGHSLGEVFPPGKYAKSHPEYYALVDDRRDVPGPDYDYKHSGQICTTNPEVIRIAIEWAQQFFNAHPEYDGIHLTPNDGSGFCECERCRALDSGRFVERPGIDLEEMKRKPTKYSVITDRIFTFMNQVALEVEKSHPGKCIVSMAYSRYALPPETICLHPMVIPQYCLWSAYRHSNPGLHGQHLAIADGWAKAAKKKAIYEYYINGSWPGLHRLAVGCFARSIKELHRMGFDLYQTQSGDEFAINGIQYYLAAKLLWDVSTDENQILDDFYKKAFGKAGAAIKRFHARLEKSWAEKTKDGEDVSCQSIDNTRLLELFTPRLLKACQKDLEDAGKMADTETIKKRIDFFRKGFRFTELTVNAVRASRKLTDAGLSFSDPGTIKKKMDVLPSTGVDQMVKEALTAWQERDAFVEAVKNDFVLAYFWVKYNDTTRKLNVHPDLIELSKKVEY